MSPLVPVYCYTYHLSHFIVAITSLGLNNNRSKYFIGYLVILTPILVAINVLIFCPSFVLYCHWNAYSTYWGLKMYLGDAQSLGQEYPLPDIVTPPHHNLVQVYLLVSRNTHTQTNKYDFPNEHKFQCSHTDDFNDMEEVA